MCPPKAQRLQVIPGQPLSCEGLLPKAGALSLLPQHAAFSAGGRYSRHPGRTARALDGQLQPLPLSEIAPSLGVRPTAVQWAVSDVESAAFPKPASVLSTSAAGITSHLLLVHTLALLIS